MFHFICQTCGVQYAKTATPPTACLICEDERQYVPASGTTWTTLADMQGNYQHEFTPLEADLTAITVVPKFAIGQRALLVRGNAGNMLWDTNSYIDHTTVATIKEMGGLTAIAISHPHFYDSMVEWSEAFGSIPIYLHADDQDHVMRPHPNIHYWQGDSHTLADDITLVRCGGHFVGSSVLHWQAGAEGKGVLLTSDTIMVTPNGRVTFMYSYPNALPMPAFSVQRIADTVAPYAFDRIYGGWSTSLIPTNAHAVVQESANRYLEILATPPPVSPN